MRRVNRDYSYFAESQSNPSHLLIANLIITNNGGISLQRIYKYDKKKINLANNYCTSNKHRRPAEQAED